MHWFKKLKRRNKIIVIICFALIFIKFENDTYNRDDKDKVEVIEKDENIEDKEEIIPNEDLENTVTIARSYNEYSKIFVERLNVLINKYEDNFNGSYYRTAYPYVHIRMFSNLVDSDKEYEGTCKIFYDEIVNIINEIQYKPKGIIKDEVIVSVEFFMHDCDLHVKHYVNRGCFQSRGFMQIYIRNNEIPEFKYVKTNKIIVE